MRVVLVLMILLLVPMSTGAKGADGKRSHRTVYDYSGPAWSPVIQDAVGRFNVMLPKRAPRLIYRAMTGPCVPYRKHAITVCVVSAEQLSDHEAAAETTIGKRATIRIVDVARPDLALACHELTHAMGVNQHGPWVLMRPCPYDADLMHDLYKRHRKHH